MFIIFAIYVAVIEVFLFVDLYLKSRYGPVTGQQMTSLLFLTTVIGVTFVIVSVSLSAEFLRTKRTPDELFEPKVLAYILAMQLAISFTVMYMMYVVPHNVSYVFSAAEPLGIDVRNATAYVSGLNVTLVLDVYNGGTHPVRVTKLYMTHCTEIGALNVTIEPNEVRTITASTTCNSDNISSVVIRATRADIKPYRLSLFGEDLVEHEITVPAVPVGLSS